MSQLEVREASPSEALTLVNSETLDENASLVGVFELERLVGVAGFSRPKEAWLRRFYTAELTLLEIENKTDHYSTAESLLAGYIRLFAPTDFFVRPNLLRKELESIDLSRTSIGGDHYLLARGRTLANAKREELLRISHAAERFDDSRLTTFVDQLEWSIQSSPRLSVLQWLQPERTYYTYKTTAEDSPKYYYGFSHIKKAQATVEDCKDHKYFGSGDPKAIRNKFINWRRKHEANLSKEITGVFKLKAQALEHEWELITELWKTDKLCLNSGVGGKGGRLQRRDELRICATHGVSSHQGERCRRCVAQETISLKLCSIHGEVTFWGDSCARCNALALVTLKLCPSHGEVKHRGDICYRCEQGAALQLKRCAAHAEALHQGECCTVCASESRVSLKHCAIHGEAKHQGDSCYPCSKERSKSFRSCQYHGETEHKGRACLKCSAIKAYSTQECARHGAVKFRGGSCASCSAEKTAHKRFHGAKPSSSCLICNG